MENFYDQGRDAHAAGKALADNPYESGTQMSDWAAGWNDAQVAVATPVATEGDTPPVTEGGTPSDIPGAASGTADGEGASETPPGTDETETTTPPGTDDGPGVEEPLAAEVVEALGDVGYERIMELLSQPPIDDDGVSAPGLPVGGEVPDDLREWLKAWKVPIAFVAVDTVLDAVKTRIGGTSRGRLKELYRGMSPLAMAAAMQVNAETITEFADQRVAEAGLISSLQASVTQKAAGYLLNALLLV